MLGKRKTAQGEEYVQVAERLRPYVDASANGGVDEAPPPEIVDDLLRKAAMLLDVMPRNQRRETIVELISPYDAEKGRRAVDALIEASLVTEDVEGRLRRVR